jgi:hypothetical protein
MTLNPFPMPTLFIWTEWKTRLYCILWTLFICTEWKTQSLLYFMNTFRLNIMENVYLLYFIYTFRLYWMENATLLYFTYEHFSSEQNGTRSLYCILWTLFVCTERGNAALLYFMNTFRLY